MWPHFLRMAPMVSGARVVNTQGWMSTLLLVAAAVMLAPLAGAAAGPRTTEYAIVPLAGGDTDIGFGAGALGSMARLDPTVKPYVWRLEGTVFLTAKRGDSGFSLPYQDGFLLLTIANLLGGRGRLELRPSYTRENNLRYHGLGNASQAEGDDVPARDFYTRVHPALLARGRYQLYGPLNLVVGALYTHSWIDFEPQSNLVRDLTTGSPEVKSLLNVDRNHGLFLLEAGLLFDTRDNEIAPNRGQLHSVKLRASPGGWGPLPYHYVQINLNVRGFHRLGTDRLVFAWRGIGDLLLGTIPFYELSRYDEASAIGGANGVRGIRGDRYYGKRKLFGNLELRSTLWNFQVRGSPYALGVTGFVDGGRVWADTTSQPELDGTGIGLHYGVGGGLRLRKGETFVLRADVAWSEDARPLGFYFLAGNMF
jgi:hypothetical protein